MERRIIEPTREQVLPGQGPSLSLLPLTPALDTNLHSLERRLIELRIEHSDLDAMLDRASADHPLDELLMRRLKKKRLGLRDEMTRIERMLSPDEPA